MLPWVLEDKAQVNVCPSLTGGPAMEAEESDHSNSFGWGTVYKKSENEGGRPVLCALAVAPGEADVGGLLCQSTPG